MAARRAVVALAAVRIAGWVPHPTRPEGAGLAWARGSFCGSSKPDLGSGTPEERRAALLAIEPVDHIAAPACRHPPKPRPPAR